MKVEEIQYNNDKILVKIYSSRKYKNLSISVTKKYIRISKPIYVSKIKSMQFLYKNIDKIYNEYKRINSNLNENVISNNLILMIGGVKSPLIIKKIKDNSAKLEVIEGYTYFYINENLGNSKVYELFRICFKNYLKNQTKKLLEERLTYWSNVLNEKYNNVSIKCQKTVWGSAVPASRNLNFNMKIAMLPVEVADYIIIHELCHFKQANHSSKFWEQVEKYDPNYREHKKYLKNNIKYFDII